MFASGSVRADGLSLHNMGLDKQIDMASLLARLLLARCK